MFQTSRTYGNSSSSRQFSATVTSQEQSEKQVELGDTATLETDGETYLHEGMEDKQDEAVNSQNPTGSGAGKYFVLIYSS